METATTELDVCLRERFGLEQFRTGQREVIEAVLAQRDCLCVMPTGGGKSLCFQLPSLLLDGVTLVVSPLIALMKDQVDRLVARGIRATLINSTIDAATQNERIAAMERGEYDLVYIAPERFRSTRFGDAIARTRVALLAVDEAHCISEWGHDFRPDYTRLGRARRRLGNPATIALTATATDNVRRDICEQLELNDPRVFVTGFDRPNLRYEVRPASSDSSKQNTLTKVLSELRGSGIIYCSSRKRCEEVSEFLKEELQRKSLVYHAGMPSDDRRVAQDRFMNGRDLIVVATNAFGMGVDKPDIRFVIHYNIPGTIEAYYQEAGRAGRDGAESLCLMLYAAADRFIQEFFIESEYPKREVIESIYQFLAAQPTDPIELTQEQIKDRLRLEISEMGVGASLKLLESAGVLERLRPRENMAMIRITSEASLVGLLPQSATIQRRVLSALERLVADTPGDDTYFHPHLLAARLELEPAQFSRAIHELCEKLPRSVSYVPPFRGNAVRMIDRSRALGNIGIDYDRLDERRKREFVKLDKIIAYAQSLECRRSTILTYFGEQSAVKCGHCDRCDPNAAPRHVALLDNDQVRETVRKVLSGIARATRGRMGFGKRVIASMLVGKNVKAVKRWGMDKLSTFGILSNFDVDEVVLLIESLIATGWVDQDEPERFKPVIRLSAIGHEVMIGEREAACAWQLPAQLLGKLQRPSRPSAKRTKTTTDRQVRADTEVVDSEPVGPLDRELFKKLKTARDRWAIEANLPAYMVLSNPVLEGLARAKPNSIDRMLAIKGMGPAKVARYGERLLQILGGVDAAVAIDKPVQARGTRRPRAIDFDRLTPAPSLKDNGQRKSQRPTSNQSDYYWTWRLLERGFTQSECALIRGLDETTILNHAIEAARDGHHIPLDAFLTDDLVATLEQWVESQTGATDFSDSDLPMGVTSGHVELCVSNRSGFPGTSS